MEELPLGFGMALAQNPRAMEYFSKQTKEKQAEKNRQAAEAAKDGKKKHKAPAEVEEESLIDLVENDEVDEKALSQKEINRMKLAAARRRDAERYGEEYVDVSDEDLE